MRNAGGSPYRCQTEGKKRKVAGLWELGGEKIRTSKKSERTTIEGRRARKESEMVFLPGAGKLTVTKPQDVLAGRRGGSGKKKVGQSFMPSSGRKVMYKGECPGDLKNERLPSAKQKPNMGSYLKKGQSLVKTWENQAPETNVFSHG